MSDSAAPSDKQLLCYQRFNATLRKRLAPLITDALIAEHRAKPLGQHSDDLERVLNFLRRPPQYGLYSRKACREFQVITLPIAPSGPPQFIDDVIYTDKDEALHAVFLKSIETITNPPQE